jgi:hypothetical protein
MRPKYGKRTTSPISWWPAAISGILIHENYLKTKESPLAQPLPYPNYKPFTF